MSAKFLQVFTDENQELQKQIGCMNGIFQIFDRQNMVTAGRRIHSHGHSHKKLTYVPANSSREIHQADDGMNFSHKVLEKNLKKSLNNDKRTSVESSRTSFSSSSCSSFSSQQEAPPFELTNYQEKSFKESSKVKTFNIDGRPPRHERDPPISSNQIARRSLDFRDVVKDSINRDSKSLLTKCPPLDMDIKNNHVSKYVDSPRPLHISKSMNESKTRDQLPWNFSELKESPRPSFEMPRQSLDSREGSKLSTNKLQELPRLSLDSRVEQNQSLILKEIDRRDRNQMALPDSKQKGSTSVVAKLMGLEEMPSLSIVTHVQNLTTLEEYKEEEDHFIHSARKPIDIPRFPIEAAPWRKQEKIHVSPKTNIVHQKKLFYNETERRLNELEFTESNKDLRALKQILDAMQAKGLLETSKCNKKQNFVKGRTMGNSESPIVIMKPKNSVKKSGIRPSSVIPLDRLSMDKRKVSASNQTAKEQPINLSLKEVSDKNKSLPRTTQRESSNTSNSLSPRLQKSRNLTDNKKISESVSPRTKLRNKPLMRHSNELLCQEISQISDRNTSMISHVDADVTSPCRSTENFLISPQGSKSPSSKTARKVASIVKQKKPSISTREENSNMEPISPGTEQPSPVSVLGSSFQQDNLPLTPLKKSSRNRRDEKDQTAEENITSKNLKKFQNINNLLQKLTELSSNDNKLSTTDHIASLCETQDPDHRYISEILLASGLLFKDFNGSAPIKLHPSGHPINPDLFLVLEQTKNKSESMNKVRRKFLFDAVNEVLIRKLDLYSEGKFPSGQKLLKELCVDVEKLQKCDENSDDGTKIVGRWEEMRKELPGLVLDIERSIFKELIDEVVNGEIMASSALKTRRRRRQLTL